MSFNIRYGTANDGDNSWPFRRDFVLQVIADQAPDILGIQEALNFQVDELSSGLDGYALVGVGRDDGRSEGEYAAILYLAARFELQETGTFWLSDTPEIPGSASWGNRVTRICTWARLRDRNSGISFYAYNVHLDHESQPSRERSAELLAARIASRTHPDPVIVTGDFNAGEQNSAM
jgi:endonuclease/exonuclease/phosphatase family metal-dependent hydrolase